MRKDSYLEIERGSVVYGTISPTSDVDHIIIVPDTYKDFLNQFEGGVFEYKDTISESGKELDCAYIAESRWIQMIEECDVAAMEGVFTPEDNILFDKGNKFDEYKSHFNLDKWKVRQKFSGTASNSWAKAHKKMTVEKDLDIYRGQKSLFHCLRILMFANQLCEFGQIKNFQEANALWWEIYREDLTWEQYKEKYKPVYNSLRSKLAILAPKPVEQ